MNSLYTSLLKDAAEVVPWKETSVDLEVHATAGREAGATVSSSSTAALAWRWRAEWRRRLAVPWRRTSCGPRGSCRTRLLILPPGDRRWACRLRGRRR